MEGAAHVSIFVLLGAACSAAYGVALAYNARLYLSNGRLGSALLAHAGRTLLLLVALTSLARTGPAAFAAALGGFAAVHLTMLTLSRRRA